MNSTPGITPEHHQAKTQNKTKRNKKEKGNRHFAGVRWQFVYKYQKLEDYCNPITTPNKKEILK